MSGASLALERAMTAKIISYARLVESQFVDAFEERVSVMVDSHCAGVIELTVRATPVEQPHG